MHKMMSKSWMSWHKQSQRRNAACSRRVLRHRWGQPMTPSQAKLCYVYLLVHRDEPRFKIGISKSPFSRMKGLPEHACIAPENSFEAELPSRIRANQVEKALHRLLSGLRLHVVDDDARPSNGNTEWFEIQGLSLAINILQNTPSNNEDGGAIVLRRLDPCTAESSSQASASEARARKQFDAAQANISRMNEINTILRRLNDEITITWRKAERGSNLDASVRSPTLRSAAAYVHGEMVCLHGLGDLWEPETLAFRYSLTDSSLWMFQTGKQGKAPNQISWLRKIQFDLHQKASLLLFVQDRAELRKLAGGEALIRLWDGLWSE